MRCNVFLIYPIMQPSFEQSDRSESYSAMAEINVFYMYIMNNVLTSTNVGPG